MKCPFCGYHDNKVVDSRVSSDGNAVRRRRECLKCNRRFTTYEYVEDMSLSVVKKDGSRQIFDRQKVMLGIKKACEKRPVSNEVIENVITQIEQEIYKKFDKEVTTADIGEMVMNKLSGVDEVAYVRFASVYRQFKDVNQFMRELKDLFHKKGNKEKVSL